ncbi:MAG: Holliday junction resolvase RuvX [Gammaproteobacteria bacterium]|nr:Holliday junction resolvase RuvX [Gammaproteobacteria bacterium]
MQTLLGFDFGKRRIGIAVGQGVTGTASALCTISSRHGAPDWDRISALIEEWRPQSLVVGLPRHADSSDSDMTRAAREFAQQLEARYRLPVTTMDERLSSHAAAELQRESTGSVNTGIDAIAAQIILQDWLDTNNQ